MNSSADTRGSSRRGALKITAILSILMFALFAINAPSAFAQSSTATVTATVAQQASDNVISAVADKANPATVTVYNLQQVQSQFGQGSSDSLQPAGSGSGYIISEDGYVVTNNHVVEGGAGYQVTFMDGTTVDATLVGTDPYQDVAVLKLSLSAGQTVPGVLTFGDSSSLKVGDTVIAIGSPFGEYANTVTSGIVNATDRSLDTGEGYLLPNLIQHDAQIYPGDSGGPLLNADGEVIGMNVAKAVDPTMGYGQQDTSNIGFAIESNAVKAIVDQLIANGTVSRAYLGVHMQISDQGQVVQSVEDGGPGAAAGLQAGDVITKIDGTTIDDQHPLINELIFNHQPGDKVTLTIERNGSETTVTVTLGERPADT